MYLILQDTWNLHEVLLSFFREVIALKRDQYSG